jgi:EAL and modified HD-GYP domain-containing signal transduction protein
MDRELAEILAEIPVSDELKAALLGQENQLHEVYACALAYEHGQWERFSERAARIGLDAAISPQLYLEALAWAEQSFQVNALTH